MKDALKLYAVSYCNEVTLDWEESIRTHSREKAEMFAKYFASLECVLYSQVRTYVYNERTDFYEFATSKNYYKED